MLPPWIIAELERRRREREREREREQPVLEVDPPKPPRQAPRPETPSGVVVIEF